MLLIYLFFALSTVVLAEGKKPYISQEYVDTVIQNAFYAFVEASGRSEGYTADEATQIKAIQSAKLAAENLKKLAKNDPNRRYVLWRVSELEKQIFLEEEEVLLKKMYRNQKAVNVLVDKFNTETGKWRPGFANLVAIHSSMLNLNPQKADEIARLIEVRDRNISREVTFSIEKALLYRNYDKAGEEFEYVKKNRKYLLIPEDKFADFEKRIRIKVEADELVTNIDGYISDIKLEIDNTNLCRARRGIEFMQERIGSAHTMIEYEKYNKFKETLKTLAETVGAVEDSLVYQNLLLLHEKSVDDAVDYLNTVLRRSGVSPEKIMMVNQSIMEAPGQKRATIENKKVDRELIALEKKTTAGNSLSFGDVAAKAKARMDSVKTYQQEQARLQQLEYERTHKKEIAARQKEEKKKEEMRASAREKIMEIYALLEKNKIEKAQAKVAELRGWLVQNASPDDLVSLDNAIAKASEPPKSRARPQNNGNQKAEAVSKEIYALLKQNNADGAYSKFNSEKELLQKSLPESDCAHLESSVKRAYELALKERLAKAERKAAAAVTSVATAAPQPAAEKSDNGDQYAVFDKAQVNAQQKAENDVMTIYTMLENNEIQQAYDYFRKNQILLKTYIYEEAYQALESSVADAYTSFKNDAE